ncbi:hypothetical protein P280DRAFT_530740 [Massarina eburnea CBS 473.64]|uniref:Dockerin type 1 n=1 Tax=Massarina eburnea CBS 473.64 TaxID=1395130 RepID=A0A6A6RR45_9PLEO|nr:hypothetical protein P280DRAFT_530740 [Massarina eburnea CBS 473.64]
MLLLTLTTLLSSHAILTTALPPPTRRQVTAPAQYTANPSIGDGSGTYKDSAHFRVYGASSTTADQTLKVMEAAHQCFVTENGWRTPGLSYKTGGVGNEVGPWYKMNIYQVTDGSLPGAAAETWTDANAGLAFLKVVDKYMTTPGVIVHEFGHAMHYSEKNWIDQTRTGAWWETIANFVADLYFATPTCDAARAAAGLSGGDSLIEPKKVIGDSFQVIVDGTSGTGNYYQAFPLLSYITNNPDNYGGLGKTVLLDMIRKYKLNSDETPLHSLERLLSGVTIQKVIGRYWARMAYVDINHPKAQTVFNNQRSSINYANLDSNGNGKYTVKSARAPRYMGANITPLKATGTAVSVAITVASGGSYTATLAVKGSSATRYVDFSNGSASVTLASGEEVSLVVANTPALVQYDAFSIPTDLNKGLSYSVQITGATV